MPDLAALGVDRTVVERMYEEWKAGASRSPLERRYFAKGESHGKLFTALVKQELGVDTERGSRLGEEIHRLREENAPPAGRERGVAPPGAGPNERRRMKW